MAERAACVEKLVVAGAASIVMAFCRVRRRARGGGRGWDDLVDALKVAMVVEDRNADCHRVLSSSSDTGVDVPDTGICELGCPAEKTG